MSDPSVLSGTGTAMRRIFLQARESTLSSCPDELVSTFAREFHAMFTFAVVLPIQVRLNGTFALVTLLCF